MDLGLNGRRVLVTGGSQDIGYAIVRGFLAEGCSAVIISRDAQRLQQALAELGKDGPVTGKAIDLAQRGAAEAVADEFKDTDILVNNAGAIPTGDIFSVDEARWREAWDFQGQAARPRRPALCRASTFFVRRQRRGWPGQARP